MKLPKCKATTKAQWHGPGHPCRCLAWKDGLCRTHYASAQRPAKIADTTSTGLRQRNKELRAIISAQRKALRIAKRLLERSAKPFDAGCVVIRKALGL